MANSKQRTSEWHILDCGCKYRWLDLGKSRGFECVVKCPDACILQHQADLENDEAWTKLVDHVTHPEQP